MSFACQQLIIIIKATLKQLCLVWLLTFSDAKTQQVKRVLRRLSIVIPASFLALEYIRVIHTNR